MQKKSTIKDKLPLIVSAVLILALAGSYFFIPAVQAEVKDAFRILTSDDRPRISQYVSQFGFWGPFWLVIAMMLQMFLVVINVVALMVVAVLAYGPFWGSLVALAGIFAASTLGYWLGFLLGQNTVNRLIGARTERKMKAIVERYGFWAIVVTRISPFLSNDAVGFVAGLTCMNYFKFIAATLIGILPLTILIAWLSTDIDRLKDGVIWVSVLSLLAFGIYVFIDRRKRKIKSANRS